MIRKVTRIVVRPYLLGDKWQIIVESRNYGKAPNHILEFDSKEAADQVCIGYEYSTDNIYKAPVKDKNKTLSVQEPFALLEVMGIKDIENRVWKTDYRGRIYIHACARKTGKLKYQLTDSQKSVVSGYPIVKSLLNEDVMYSAIIGHVDLIDIVEDSKSIWALEDHYHWMLGNPVMYENPVINVKGNLGFWDCSGYLTKSTVK